MTSAIAYFTFVVRFFAAGAFFAAFFAAVTVFFGGAAFAAAPFFFGASLFAASALAAAFAAGFFFSTGLRMLREGAAVLADAACSSEPSSARVNSLLHCGHLM